MNTKFECQVDYFCTLQRCNVNKNLCFFLLSQGVNIKITLKCTLIRD